MPMSDKDLKRTDVGVVERRRMLDFLVEAHENGHIDVNFGMLIVPNETQRYALAWRYNEIVKPEFHLDPEKAFAMLTDPEDGHNLNGSGMINIHPKTEHLLDGDMAGVKGTASFEIQCNYNYEDADGNFIGGDANRGDDVQLARHSQMTDGPFGDATEFLDWGVIRERAIENGYVPGKYKGKTADQEPFVQTEL